MKKKHIIALVVIIVILALAAGAAIFVFSKLSLVNHAEVDESKIQVSETFKEQTDTNVQTDSSTAAAVTPDSPYSGYEIIALVGLDTRDASERANSDTMIFACLNHDEKTIKLFSLYRDTYLNVGGYYSKCNAAYCAGGPEQFLSMANLNLDLNVTKFVTTNFNALAQTIDLLGGLDIEMTRQELIHMNNYNVETSKVCGVEYQAIEVPDANEFDGGMIRTFHCTGTQAVSYARIRYTEGWDYKRTERQRIVLQKIKEKMKDAGVGTLISIVNTVFPQLTTNLSSTEIISLGTAIMSYQVVDQTGFPFDKAGMDVDGLDAVIPVTLESNVVQLHEFIYPGIAYSPSSTVQEYSNYIASKAAGGSGNASETETPTPSPTPTVTPTVTPTPTETPAPTEEPTPEPTEEPTPEPTEEPTPAPTEEPTPEAEAVLESVAA